MAGRGKNMVKPAWMTRNDGPSVSRRNDGPSVSRRNDGQSVSRNDGQSVSRNDGQSVSRNDGPSMSSSFWEGKPSQPPQTGGWSEHKSPEGKVYFFNQFTKESTFDKPAALMSESERKLPSSDWKEFAREGKIYYFNKKTKESIWEEPMQFTRYKERLRALCAGAPPTKDMESLAVFKAARKALDECSVASVAEPKKEVTYRRAKPASELPLREITGVLLVPDSKNKYKILTDTETAIKEFKCMLKERKVPPNSSWVEAMTYGIPNDPRFHAVKGLVNKQQVLAEYSEARQVELEEEKRQLKKHLVKDLEIILEDMAIQKKINGKSRRREVLDQLEGHPILKAFPDSKTLENSILDYLDVLYAKEKAAKAALKETEKDLVIKKLSDMWKDKEISHESSWTGIPEKLNVLDLKILVARDLQDHFLDFVKEQKEKEKRQKEEAVAGLKNSHKDLLLEFKGWVQQQLTQARTLPLSLKEYLEDTPERRISFLDNPLVKSMILAAVDAKIFTCDAGLDYPTLLRDEFEETLDTFLDQMDACRKLIRGNLTKKVRTKYDSEAMDQLLCNSDDMINSLDSDTRKQIFDEYPPVVVESVFDRLVADADKKVEKRKTRFSEMLKDVLRKEHHTGMTWDDAIKKLRKEPEFEELIYDDVRKQLFDHHMIWLQTKFSENTESSKRSRSRSGSTSPKKLPKNN